MTPRVLHVTGAGHSGSTVLDIVLGNQPQIESVGELHKLHRSGWTPAPNRRCACGEEVDRCPYWSEVRRRWEESVGGDRLREYVALQNRFEGSVRSWPRLMKAIRTGSEPFRRYSELSAALYRAICETSGKSSVADSSKKPQRAYALAMNAGLDVRVLHLVRDGRGVVWSQIRPRARNVAAGIPEDHEAASSWRTTSRWLLRNLECEWLRRRLGPERVLRVSYERFTHEPALVLGEIGRFLEADFGGVIAKVSAGRSLEIGHLVAGNALRMRGSLVLRPVSDWTAELPRRHRWIFWALAGRLARRYGYER